MCFCAMAAMMRCERLLAHAHVRRSVDWPMPDASNIGGVTGWMKVATLAQALNLPVCSHGNTTPCHSAQLSLPIKY